MKGLNRMAITQPVPAQPICFRYQVSAGTLDGVALVLHRHRREPHHLPFITALLEHQNIPKRTMATFLPQYRSVVAYNAAKKFHPFWHLLFPLQNLAPRAASSTAGPA
jgi:hypothetical protein